MATTIPLQGAVRDRLRLYGTAGMTYNDILIRMMDALDRKQFLDEIRRRVQKLTDKDLIDLEDVK